MQLPGRPAKPVEPLGLGCAVANLAGRLGKPVA
jgi:hypothetical protein